jgi:UDP-N-acetylmuramoyl-L-alanyl-D-glutamate--2,6-diaminopimelate ligase
MRLHELLRGIRVERLPAEDPEVTGICHDSRRLAAGDLYAAIVGERYDGRRFAAQAAERGAVAVLGPGDPPAGLTLPWIRAGDPRRLLGPLAARLHGNPHDKLLMMGVTGTNGKTTVVALLARIAAAAGRRAATLGTLGARVLDDRGGDGRLDGAVGHLTTPEAPDLFRTLAAMRRDGVEAVAMEVSSHALELGRVAGVGFDVAVFTNLSQDHLDFHPDLESYFAAKRRLFDLRKAGGRAVVSLGDPWGRRLAAEIDGALTFGEVGEVAVQRSELTLDGTRARIATPRGVLAVESKLLGRFNLENLLAAVAAAEALELDHAAIAEGVARQRPLPGRLEPVDAGQEFPAFVDYAHTPAALEAVLRAVHDLSGRQVALVFGCAGDRDPGKRPLMGRIAGRWAELPVVTSDNPRSEDPLEIMWAVETGLKESLARPESGDELYRMIPDRREAIRRAVAVAKAAPERWVVVVAGKGHEREQEVGGRRLPFSDREELAAAIRESAVRESAVGDPAAVTTEADHG